MFSGKSNLVAVPKDLAAVTSIDHAAECRPRDVDLTPHGVDQIWRAVQAFYRSGLQPAITLVLRRRGQIVLKRGIGHARGNGPGERDAEKILATADTPVCLFSASKAISAFLLHKLVEQKKLKLSDCVATYLPEYKAHGKGGTTLRELLSHRAGIPRVPVKNPDPSILYDWDKAVRMLCEAPPVHSARQQQAYHAITAGYIVGEVVRRVSGKPLPRMLKETLADPLGCRDFSYGLPPARRADAALNYSTGPRVGFPLNLVAQRALGIEFERVAPISNEPDFLSAVIPAGNIYASADEVARFFQMLLDEGQWQGRSLFQPDTVCEALKPVGKLVLDRTMLVPVRFSAGMVLGEKLFWLYGRNCGRAFGHLGFINIVCWADPQRDIAVALLNTGKSLAPASLPALGRILWAVSHYCPPIES